MRAFGRWIRSHPRPRLPRDHRHASHAQVEICPRRSARVRCSKSVLRSSPSATGPLVFAVDDTGWRAARSVAAMSAVRREEMPGSGHLARKLGLVDSGSGHQGFDLADYECDGFQFGSGSVSSTSELSGWRRNDCFIGIDVEAQLQRTARGARHSLAPLHGDCDLMYRPGHDCGAPQLDKPDTIEPPTLTLTSSRNSPLP